MDTNDLKSIWQQHTSEKAKKDQLSEDELSKLRFAKSTSLVRKIKNMLIFELLTCVLMVVLLSLSLLQDLHLIIKISIITLDVVFIFLFGIYFQYVRSIKVHDIQVMNLKDSLDKLILKVEKMLKFLFTLSIILIPIGSVCGYVGGFFIGAQEEAIEKFNSTANIIILPIMIIGITLLSIPLAKFYLKFFYGRHLDNLKKTLSELISENGNH